MGDVFLKLLNMSITAAWFILAVVCIRLIFRKIPKWVNCLLWGAVAIRLICPFSIESRFSILPSTEPIKSSTVVGGEVQNYIPSIDSHLTIVEHTINPMLKETFAYHESASAAPWQIITYIAGLAWVSGMIFLIICAMGSMIRLHNLVREAVCFSGNIYICDAVKTPFILGIARPRIYLPSALSEIEMNHIIAHESAHLKRRDHWWKALGYVLLCVYWFNPLCWAAYALFCKDMELACDEKLVKNMTFCEKKEYSNVLLSCTRHRRMVMVCPLAFGEVGIKERVISVLNYKKPTLWIMIAAAAVCMGLAVCLLTNPTTESQIRIRIPAGITEIFSHADEAAAQEEDPEKGESAQAKEMQEENVSVEGITLYEHPQADKVCIEVQPAMIRKKPSYFYIPTGEDQKWLLEYMKSLDLEGQRSSENRLTEGHKETGWQIFYNDVVIMAFEDGYLYYTYQDDENELMECVIEEPELCSYIQNMLEEEIGYQKYDISNIKDIVSAKLEVNSIFTDRQFYSQTITDAETLQKFEEWFRNAEYTFDAAGCANECACLELTLADGEIVKLSMATDSCPYFSIHGVGYNYQPASGQDNSEFYKCFHEIPWQYE